MATLTSSSSSSSAGGTMAMTTSITRKSKSETVNYLLLYEAMVRHQDLEYDATHDHIALTVGRIRHLGRPARSKTPWKMGELVVEDDDDDDGPKGMLTYLQMRRCLLRLGYTWNRSLPPPPSSGASSASSSSGVGNYHYDDDVSVASNNSASTLLSGGGQTMTSATTNATSLVARDIIATDAQLIMLLTTLVEMEESCRAERLEAKRGGRRRRGNNAGDDYDDEDDYDDGYDDDDDDEDPFSRGLFLPEFIQAYKLIIGGMQSLQTYPIPPRSDDDEATRRNYRKACASLGLSLKGGDNDDPNGGGGDEDDDDETATTLHELRLRSRERTLGLLRLFGPNSKDLYADKKLPKEVVARTAQSAGESPTHPRRNGEPSNKPGASNSHQHNISGRGGRGKHMMTAKDGLLPRLTEEQIRKMVHSKDTALARILEEHESEMNVMATNMEELRLRTLASSQLLKKRRKRARLVSVLGLAAAIVGGVAYEYRRREQVRVEISTGREAERLTDATTIANLQKDVSALTSKLKDADATIRYEEARYASIQLEHERLLREHEETERKWLMNARDLEHCQATRKELDAELSDVKSRNAEVGEEVAWCRERLQNSEMAMLGMERAMKKSRDDMMAMMMSGSGEGGGGAGGRVGKLPSLADIAREIEVGVGSKGLAAIGDDKGREGGDKREGNHRPVFTEMKYNRSFRNAVILRQAYSAVAGMLVSIVGGALFPSIAKVFGLLFMG